MLTPQRIIKDFQKYKVKFNSYNNKSREKVTPCLVITKVLLDVSLNTIKEQLNERESNLKKYSGSKAALQTKKQD